MTVDGEGMSNVLPFAGPVSQRRDAVENAILSRFPRIEDRDLIGCVRELVELTLREPLPEEWGRVVELCSDEDRANDALATLIAAFAMVEKAVYEARSVRLRRRAPPTTAMEWATLLEREPPETVEQWIALLTPSDAENSASSSGQ